MKRLLQAACAMALGFTSCAAVETNAREMDSLVTAVADKILNTDLIRTSRTSSAPLQIAVLSLHERTADGLQPCPPGSPRWLSFQRAIHKVFEAPLYTDDLDHVHYQFLEPYLPGTLETAFEDLQQDAPRRQVVVGVEETGVTIDYFARGILTREPGRESLHVDLLHARSGQRLSVRTAPRRRQS